MASQSFEEGLVLPTAVPKNNLNPPDTQSIAKSIETISKRYAWVSPNINGKAVSLNKSILLVSNGNQIFDLMVEKPLFRSPMTNKFILGDKTKDPAEETLPNIYSPNIGDLDADDDGFSNLEEFNGGTNPRDDKSLPPYTNKLFLKQRIANDYILMLNSGEDSGTFQIRRIKPEPARSIFTTVGTEFGFDKGVNRFVILSFTKQKVKHATLGEIDAYVVKVRDNATQAEVELVQRIEKNLAEYEAQFEFRWKQIDIIAGVKKGKTFQLPRVGETYYVREIEENKAVISPVDKGGQPTTKTFEIIQN
ncbi:MAG: hypothetical protein IPK32_05575 [Verrucomicrobiaceae bacterium]|nr:hypothetical protein [Verrucomicrobiaceae bacterium]